MTPEEYEALEKLFHSAQELGENERAAFIEAGCAQAPHLRPLLEDMLRQDNTTALMPR